VVLVGINGLVALKTYCEINADEKALLLDSQSSIGGVWASERLYAGLKSNNMLGTYEFSDFPMDEATFGVKPGEHIRGPTLHAYFERYVDHFGLRECIRLNSTVERAAHRPDGSWTLDVRSGEEATTRISAKKVIFATGLTSKPYLPTFDGQGSFGAPLFHIRDLKQYETEVLRDGQRVAIFGGTKSSWDAAYTCATAGMQVDWVIRESGHGPNWMAPPYVTPLKKWLEKLVHMRLLTWFSPCVWGDGDRFATIRRWLHGTWLGRKVVDAFWSILANDVMTRNGYDQHPEVRKLKPWISPFWIASSLSILNYPTNFFDLVRNGSIKIHITDITRLSPRAVHLSDGQTIPTTALICSTGWRATPNVQFLPEGIDAALGLPWSRDPLDEKLVAKADAEILQRFPKLQDQPVFNSKYKPLTDEAEASAPHPLRLYRFMIPCALAEERSIAFMGTTLTISTTLIAQTQALWIAAYFARRLPSFPSEGDLEWSTAVHTQFCKWRYAGGFGRRNPDFVFDAVPYIDTLLNDLGIRPYRKAGFVDEVFGSYGPEDYRGLIAEWLDVNAHGKKRD
jgi:hypothetical protein